MISDEFLMQREKMNGHQTEKVCEPKVLVFQ